MALPQILTPTPPPKKKTGRNKINTLNIPLTLLRDEKQILLLLSCSHCAALPIFIHSLICLSTVSLKQQDLHTVNSLS